MRGDDLKVLHSLMRGNINANQVSKDTGLPYNTVRWHIWQLVREGQVIKVKWNHYRAITVEEM